MKFCTTCKHCRPPLTTGLAVGEYSTCEHIKNFAGINPVDGQARKIYHYCNAMRSDTSYCGPKGEWHEPNEAVG